MIRTTTILDTTKMLDLVKEFYPLTSYSKWAPFDDTTVTLLMDKLRKSGILLVAQEEDELVGIIGVIGVPFIFNANVISGHEVIWWVRPSHRKSNIGQKLLERADQLCGLKGWRSFQMMRLEESSPGLDAVFIAAGFNPTEHCFTKVY